MHPRPCAHRCNITIRTRTRTIRSYLGEDVVKRALMYARPLAYTYTRHKLELYSCTYTGALHPRMSFHCVAGTHTFKRDSILVHSEPCGQRWPAFPVYPRQPTLCARRACVRGTHVRSYDRKPRVYCPTDVTSTREPDVILHRQFDRNELCQPRWSLHFR